MRFFLFRNRDDGRFLPVAARDRYTICILHRFHARRDRDIQPLLPRADRVRRNVGLRAGEPVVLLDQK